MLQIMGAFATSIAITGTGLTIVTGRQSALTAVMFLFTLADTGANEKLPLITIPAQ
jgi:hypothetical protein